MPHSVPSAITGTQPTPLPFISAAASRMVADAGRLAAHDLDHEVVVRGLAEVHQREDADDVLPVGDDEMVELPFAQQLARVADRRGG